jgi:hypothetical protein
VIYFHVAHVGQASDDGRGRVGRKGTFEPLLRIEPLGLVIDDQYQAVRLPGRVRQHQCADAVHPVAVTAGLPDLHYHLAERLAREQALHRVVAFWQLVPVAIGQFISLPIVGYRGAEFVYLRHPVQGQRRGVGPSYGLIGVDQDHAIGKAGNDLLKLRPVSLWGRNVIGHVLPYRNAGSLFYRGSESSPLNLAWVSPSFVRSWNWPYDGLHAGHAKMAVEN